MKRLLCIAMLAACGGGHDAPPDAGPATFDTCKSDTATWVRNAYLALVGQRPHSEAEVQVYAQLHDQIQALDDADSSLTLDPKAITARAMMQQQGYLDHWTSHFMDALRVPRVDDQDMAACYDQTLAGATSPALASYVRDNPPTSAGPGVFTMKDLIASSLALDDLTPIYRGHLFALVSFPIPAANVPPVQAELARRDDFGNVFDSAYLNRDMVCLQCHNSEESVTYNSDPAKNRWWPMAGLFEKALYGMSTGEDHAAAHAVFRFDGFSASGVNDTGPRKPWGWSNDCGTFYQSVANDPAAVDGKFGNLSGQRLTVYDLEAALKSGFDSLRGGALVPAADGSVSDPNQAFAYLTSAAIVEGVWKEVVGSGLTIANYFPRNQAARDMLQGLTDRFVKDDYSLSDLLVAIVSSDYFSRAMPEEGCGASPYTYPNVYDPWVISDVDPAKQQNGPGDSIAAVSARTLMRTAYGALEWPVPSDFDFPSGGDSSEPFCQGASCSDLQNACNSQGVCCATYQEQCVGGSSDELSFQQGTGAFLKNGERGFRGLDFQARLVWENRFGACAKPFQGTDYVDTIVAAAGQDSTATVGDVVSALKDRIIGEPAIGDDEAVQLKAMFGADLTAPATSVSDLAGKSRQLCGVLLSSPQFVLSGAAGQGGDVPKLTPSPWQFDGVCSQLAPRVGDVTVTCASGALTVTAK